MIAADTALRGLSRRSREGAEVLLTVGLHALLSRGNHESACRRTRRLARLVPRLDRAALERMTTALEIVFGDALSESGRRRLATLSCEETLLNVPESLRWRELEVRDHDGIDGLADAARRARHAGCGVVVASLHLGAWEAGLAKLGELGLPIACAYRPRTNRQLEARYQRVRAEYGVDFIVDTDGRRMIRHLRGAGILVLLADHVRRRDGPAFDLLGAPARLASGPARLALSTGSLLLPFACLRAGERQLSFDAGRPLDPEAGEDATRLTQRLARAFEPWLVEHAEQYNWLAPPWRSEPGEELAVAPRGGRGSGAVRTTAPSARVLELAEGGRVR